MDYERQAGRDPVDVSGKKDFIGFDIMSVDRSGDDHRTIEVKSARKGIPDAFDTEFTLGLRFVPTHLYLVRFKEDRETIDSLHIIPKSEIDKHADQHRLVHHIKFASRLKTDVKHGKYRVPH